MTKRNKKKVKQDRWEKKHQQGRVITAEKREYVATPVQARNEKQREFLQALNNYQGVVFIAPAGVGKSFLGMSEVSDWLKKGIYYKILLSRIAEGGKLLLLGDPTQNDLRGKNALEWLPEFIKLNPELAEHIKIIEATSDDI